MVRKRKDDDILYIFGEYPHNMMQHMMFLLRQEKRGREWLLGEEFIEKYSETFLEYPKEINALSIAKDIKLFLGFWENKKAPEWKQRVFIQTSLKRLLDKLREVEAVELLESLMWVFGWEIIVEIRRVWKVADTDKARFHQPDDPKSYKRNISEIHSLMEQYMEQENAGSKAGSEMASGSADGSSAGRTGTKKENIKDQNRSNDKKYFGSDKSSLGKEKRSGKGKAVSESGTIPDREEKVFLDSHEPGREVINELLQIKTITEEEYKNRLQKIIIKHENLMSLSVRKEIKRARQGKALSQTKLAEFYAEEGKKHTDYVEAARWYGFAAKKGVVQAKFALGKLFDSGKLGKGEIQKTGLHYFRELAEEGYPTAQSILGMKYFLGDGVEKNTAEAVKWLKKAAAQGQEEARRQLEKIMQKR